MTNLEAVEMLKVKANEVIRLDNESTKLMNRFMDMGDVDALDKQKDVCAKCGNALKEFNDLHKRVIDEGCNVLVYRDKFTAVPTRIEAA